MTFNVCSFDIIGQYPEDLSILNTVADQFTPHGLAVDFGKGKNKGNDIALTSDVRTFPSVVSFPPAYSR